MTEKIGKYVHLICFSLPVCLCVCVLSCPSVRLSARLSVSACITFGCFFIVAFSPKKCLYYFIYFIFRWPGLLVKILCSEYSRNFTSMSISNKAAGSSIYVFIPRFTTCFHGFLIIIYLFYL
jgi:hypothetical protein